MCSILHTYTRCIRNSKAAIDTHASARGEVDVKEMKGVFQAVGISLKPYQMDKIIGEFDVDGSGEARRVEAPLSVEKVPSRQHEQRIRREKREQLGFRIGFPSC